MHSSSNRELGSWESGAAAGVVEVGTAAGALAGGGMGNFVEGVEMEAMEMGWK